MKLTQWSDEALIGRFHKLVKTERKITHLVLATIAEIDRRKLYLVKAYPNLYSFLVEGAGYSAAAAMRRIDGARLMREIPEVAEKLESGALNLSQVSKLQQAVRQLQKSTNEKVTTEVKLEILEKLEATTEKDTNKILEETLDFEPSTSKPQVRHRDDSVTLCLKFSKEQIEILHEARDLSAHAAGLEWAEVITYLAKREIKRRKGSLPQETRKADRLKNEEIESTEAALSTPQTETTSGAEVNSGVLSSSELSDMKIRTRNHQLSARLRKSLTLKDRCCQYREPQSGKICGSRAYLQVDHKKPRWAGGTNAGENLQVLCANHNRFKYLREAGIRCRE